VTYIDQGGRQVRVFFRSENGHLNVAWPQRDDLWLMLDQGTPPGTRAAGDPVAVTYFYEEHIQRIYCFVPGEDGQLYLNKWDGAWSWVPLGAPSGASLSPMTSLSAVVFSDQDGPDVYVFALVVSELYSTRETNGWRWRHHDEAATGLGDVAAVGYVDRTAREPRLRVFTASIDVVGVSWSDDGQNWNWSPQGLRDPSFPPLPEIGAVDYVHRTVGRIAVFFTDLIYAFALESDPQGDNLIINWWNGRIWNWGEQGRPGVGLVGKPRPAALYENSGKERVFVAVRGNDGNLYMNWWDERVQGWEWLELASPQLSMAPIERVQRPRSRPRR